MPVTPSKRRWFIVISSGSVQDFQGVSGFRQAEQLTFQTTAPPSATPRLSAEFESILAGARSALSGNQPRQSIVTALVNNFNKFIRSEFISAALWIC